MKNLRFWNHNLFKNKILNSVFFEEGYLTLPFLSESENNELYQLLSKYKENNNGFFHSRIHVNSIESEKIFELISKYIFNKIDRLELNDSYKIVGAVFVSKAKQTISKFGIHTDDSLCDERFFMPFNLWMPLVDVCIENGTLNLFPKTHLETSVFRSATINNAFTNNIEKNKKFHPVEINLKKGNVVLYHPGCIHFSGNNNSAFDRPAIVISLIPKKASLNIFIKKRSLFFNSKIYRYNIERDDFNFHSWDNKTLPPFKPEEIISI